jgi:hypothetical protein
LGHTTIISCNSGLISSFNLIIPPSIKAISAYPKMTAFTSLRMYLFNYSIGSHTLNYFSQ